MMSRHHRNVNKSVNISANVNFSFGKQQRRTAIYITTSKSKVLSAENQPKLHLSIEYDEDDDELKVMGPSNGCLPCYKPHWDYVQNGSGQGSTGIYD